MNQIVGQGLENFNEPLNVSSGFASHLVCLHPMMIKNHFERSWAIPIRFTIQLGLTLIGMMAQMNVDHYIVPQSLGRNQPVSYTHLTLPTTPYV